ncbi:MAG TPA: hypothetical protein RMH99_02130 [Sandaracinaceae bacterium LLY-WYZ-13_1]|nr:hypothetical protein [Sandaracinaceae bacterium LLY-WYZ-13_1]
MAGVPDDDPTLFTPAPFADPNGPPGRPVGAGHERTVALSEGTPSGVRVPAPREGDVPATLSLSDPRTTGGHQAQPPRADGRRNELVLGLLLGVVVFTLVAVGTFAAIVLVFGRLG